MGGSACTGCLCCVFRAYQLSDDEEDTSGRVVRSEKDKRYGMTTSPPGKGCCWLMLYFNEARLPLVSLFTYSGSICECFAFLTLILKTIMLYKHYCWLMNLVFLVYLFTYLLSFFVLFLFINHRQHCVFVVRAFVKESVFDVCVV